MTPCELPGEKYTATYLAAQSAHCGRELSNMDLGTPTRDAVIAL